MCTTICCDNIHVKLQGGLEDEYRIGKDTIDLQAL